MNGPSKNLSWKELSCKDGSPYPVEYRQDRAPKLAALFELIRASVGNKSIIVLSAYRSYLHNKLIGGAPNSQHLQGRALDLRPPDGYTVRQFHELIKDLASYDKSSIGGIGLYKTFVHVDIRPRPTPGRIAYWTGAGMKDDLG